MTDPGQNPYRDQAGNPAAPSYGQPPSYEQAPSYGQQPSYVQATQDAANPPPKRSIGLTILGWVLIVWGALGLLGTLANLAQGGGSSSAQGGAYNAGRILGLLILCALIVIGIRLVTKHARDLRKWRASGHDGRRPV